MLLRSISMFFTLKITLITLLFTLLLLATTALAAGSYSGGNGQPATPFQIADADDLIEISQHSEKPGKIDNIILALALSIR